MSKSSSQADWLALLIDGPSGVGKTNVARQLGLRFQVPWLQVDDLRLAFQRSRVTLPAGTDALHFFTDTPHVWRMPPARLCAGLVAVGNVLSPALEVVIEHHVDLISPLIIEGDGILPALFARPSVKERASDGRVRAVFLLEAEEEILFANMLARGRGIADLTEQVEAELRTEARAKWLFGQWLAQEARRYGLPVIEALPWSTLSERIVDVIGSPLTL